MTKNVTFRDTPGLDMGRYHVPGYTGHFPTKNAYQRVSMGVATQDALQNGGYFDHDIAHSVMENNREDPFLVQFKKDYRADAEDLFNFREHNQGGKPIYRDTMLPGYTGHVPCMENDIGKPFRKGTLEGLFDFERVKVGIPRFRFPLEGPTGMQPIGGREMCVTGNIDRDKVPIDDMVPLHVPRYMGYNHDNIMKTFYPRDHCYPGFAPYCDEQAETEADGRWQNPDPNRNASSLQTGPLEYQPKMLPKPDQSNFVPVSVNLTQPIKMPIVVPMLTWQPSMEKKLFKFYAGHDKSGFSGFLPNTRNVLGSSMNREINQERQIHLKRQD